MVKTKIICTLGPATSHPAILRNMMVSGMDVVRLNFSHGSIFEHKKRTDLIRSLNKKYRRHIRILQDLEGYRIRIGKFSRSDIKVKGGIPQKAGEDKQIELKKREILLLSNNEKAGKKDLIPFDYMGPLKDIKAGSFVYIDDGNIALKVKSASKNYIKTEVVVPGLLKENKGVNIPDVNLKFKNLTDKDKKDIEFGIKEKVDFIAQSFVRNKQDILNVRKFINNKGFNCQLIAKIENREGIKNIDEILNVSDGIMIARGDMGVSLPIYEIPIIQKLIIKKCNQRKKFVITATQMLESMTEHIRPTRAEVTDVANAIIDGTDYVMLSAETAVGKHPVETVKMMNKIIRFTEESIKIK
ncbi:MAG: pyruvate kinase [Candidatus Omnitrophota bacterium]